MSSETLAYTLKQRGLSHIQFRLLVHLSEMASDNDVCASIDSLTERCETSPEQIHSAIKALQKKGAIGQMSYGPVKNREGDKVLGYRGDIRNV